MADKLTYDNKAMGIEDLSPIPKKVISESFEQKKQPKPNKGVVEIEAIKAHDGLEIGYTKRVQGNSATTIYMIDKGFWKVK